MKKITGIVIILAIVIIIFLTQTSPTPQKFSDDPDYQEVKEKYNLSEDQLQILSTVNTQDSE